MPEVGDGCHPESTLGALDEEAMPLEGAEDSTNVVRMVYPRVAKNENVIEKTRTNLSKKGPHHVIHEHLECGLGITQPK